MTLSTHKVEVVPVTLEKHPNADSLSIVRVFGYTVLVRTSDWKEGMLGAYIPPDSIVDCSRAEFSFLKSGEKTHSRIKAKKMRGVQSFGLLVPAPKGAVVGDDVAAILGVTHYEPPLRAPGSGGEAETAPSVLCCLSKYDIDSLRRYVDVFVPGESVIVTEKIHGANARYAFVDGRMWCGSRTEWKREDPNNLWWRALAVTPQLQVFCEAHPNLVVYGEVYGQVQDLKYGTKPGEVRFAAFDVLNAKTGTFLNVKDSRSLLTAGGVPQVPCVCMAAFDFDGMCALAEGKSLIPGADHVREGVVVKPFEERFHQAVGRVQLKVVGAGYLEKS